jgi:hypothetical protein
LKGGEEKKPFFIQWYTFENPFSILKTPILTFPQGGRNITIIAPLGEIRKGVFIEILIILQLE